MVGNQMLKDKRYQETKIKDYEQTRASVWGKGLAPLESGLERRALCKENRTEQEEKASFGREIYPGWGRRPSET